MNEEELDAIRSAYTALVVAVEWLLTLGVPDEEHIEMQRMIIARNKLSKILRERGE